MQGGMLCFGDLPPYLNSLAETPKLPPSPAFGLIYKGAIGQPRQIFLCNPLTVRLIPSSTSIVSYQRVPLILCCSYTTKTLLSLPDTDPFEHAKYFFYSQACASFQSLTHILGGGGGGLHQFTPHQRLHRNVFLSILSVTFFLSTPAGVLLVAS